MSGKLIVSGRKLNQATGGNRWRVVSNPSANPWERSLETLMEDFPTKEHSLHAAKIRSDQGYWVDVYHIIGFNIDA